MRIVNCPKCSQPLDISTIQAGMVIKCPCGAQLKTPGVTSAPSASPAQVAPGHNNLNPLGAHPASMPMSPQTPPSTGTHSAGSGAVPGESSAGFGFNPAGPSYQPSHMQPAGQFQPAYAATPPMQQPVPRSADSSAGLSEVQQLDFVNKGVMLIFYGSIAILASAGTTSFLGFVGVYYVLGSLISLAGKGAILVGCIFTLFAPAKSNSKKYVIAALVVIGASGILLELGLAVFWSSFSLAGLRLFTLIWWLAFLSPEIGIAIYLFGLKAIAEYTGQRAAAEEAQRIAVHLLILCGIMLSYSVFVFSTMFIFYVPFLPVLIMLAMLGAMIHWTVMFLQFLDSLEFRKQRKRRRTHHSTSGWGQQRHG